MAVVPFALVLMVLQLMWLANRLFTLAVRVTDVESGYNPRGGNSGNNVNEPSKGEKGKRQE